MERRRRNTVVLALALMGGVLSAGTAAAQSCPVKIGGVLPLTGSMAPITKKIAQSAELAIEHVNQGGGIKGCQVQFILRDDQGQPAVGVDADYTTRVKAFVIVRGEDGDEALVLELQEWCKRRLRRYEFPHFITFVEDLPKTPTGKIQRYKLRESA